MGEIELMRMSDDYYRSLEGRIRVLLSEVTDLIGAEQIAEIQEFVDYSEFGVALVWLADFLVESERPVRSSIRKSISELAEVMGIADEIDAKLVAVEPEF